MKLELRLCLLLALSLLLAACAERLAPAPELPAGAAAPAAALSEPELGRGRQLYLDKQCGACHSSQAEGGIGPRLAGTMLPFDRFLDKLRTALPPKPAFSQAELTDQDAYNVYGWLQSGTQIEPISAGPALPPGQVLGMQLWTAGRCDSCHGAFAQGSATAPPLVESGFPFEMERAKMRQTADTIPEHGEDVLDDTLFRRLYNWLQAGADPAGGC